MCPTVIAVKKDRKGLKIEQHEIQKHSNVSHLIQRKLVTQKNKTNKKIDEFGFLWTVKPSFCL